MCELDIVTIKCKFFLFWKLEWHISLVIHDSYFLCFEEYLKQIHAAFAAYAAYLYISYRSNCKLSLMLILWDTYMYLYIYIYISIFQQTICFFFALLKHFVEVLRRWKKVFGCLILPQVVGQIRQSLLPQTNNFYNINWMGYNF